MSDNVEIRVLSDMSHNYRSKRDMDIDEIRRRHEANKMGDQGRADIGVLLQEIERLRAELEAAQAREADLRKTLVVYATHDGQGSDSECTLAREALALPHDDSALKERLRQERERIAKYFDAEFGGSVLAGDEVSHAIRMMGAAECS